MTTSDNLLAEIRDLMKALLDQQIVVARMQTEAVERHDRAVAEYRAAVAVQKRLHRTVTILIVSLVALCVAYLVLR